MHVVEYNNGDADDWATSGGIFSRGIFSPITRSHATKFGKEHPFITWTDSWYNYHKCEAVRLRVSVETILFFV